MERPSIGEKVKFWQEQDRINQELIPRVLKMQELLMQLAERQSEHFEDLARVVRVSNVFQIELAVLRARLDDSERLAESSTTQRLLCFGSWPSLLTLALSAFALLLPFTALA